MIINFQSCELILYDMVENSDVFVFIGSTNPTEIKSAINFDNSNISLYQIDVNTNNAFKSLKIYNTRLEAVATTMYSVYYYLRFSNINIKNSQIIFIKNGGKFESDLTNFISKIDGVSKYFLPLTASDNATIKFEGEDKTTVYYNQELNVPVTEGF